MCFFQLLPYINGIKHVARVAADADVETNLVIIFFSIISIFPFIIFYLHRFDRFAKYEKYSCYENPPQ